MKLIISLLCFALVCLACDSESEPDFASDVVSLTELPEGFYLYTLEVTSLSGITLPFQLEIQANQAERSFEEIALRAVGADGELSEVLATLDDVIVGESNDFIFRFAAVTVPGAFVPTGSDIQVDISSQATLEDDGTFCGTVSGEVLSLGLSIDGSFFGTSLWDGTTNGPSSCEEGVLVDLELINEDDCPPLKSGTNKDFPSGGTSRSFELALPPETQAAPLVFVFHGFGGNGEQMMQAGAEDLVDSLDAVVIAPDGLLNGNATSWDTFKPEAQNQDITLFDDLLTCISKQLSIDESRVYATGMSFGGLMTGTLMAARADSFAAVAPLSGGLLSGELSGGDAEQLCLPSLVLWGGEEDQAFEQDFDRLSSDLLDELSSVNAPAIACDHGGGHVISPEAFEQVSSFFNAYDGSNPCEEPTDSLLLELGQTCKTNAQ